MQEKIYEGELFESLLEISDVSSVFNILPKSEYIILGKLIKMAEESEDGGKIYLENLKKELNVPMAIVSEIVRNMSDDGLVIWELDPANKKTYVELADNGKEQYRLQNEGINRFTRKIDDILDNNERDVLYTSLKKVADVFDEERDRTETYFQFFRGDFGRDVSIVGLMKPKNTVTYILKDVSIGMALDVFKKSGFATIPVVDSDDVYVGTVSEGDLLRYICYNGMANVNEDTVESIVNVKRNPAVSDIADSSAIVQGILSQNFLSMVDEAGHFIGIITRKDVIKFLRQKAEKK
jgi:predicted transcriptional regulator